MYKVRIEYKTARRLLESHISHCQSFTMALHDLNEMGNGYKLYYILDGYDFNAWFFSANLKTPANPYGSLMKRNWREFFRLSDGKRTCAVLSPFTIIQFLERAMRLLDDQRIRAKIQQHPEISEMIEKIQQGEKTFEEIPGQYQEIIRNLYAQILDLRCALDFFTSESTGQPDSFRDLQILIKDGKIQLFNPPVPAATQISELLQYDDKRTRKAINYLRRSRASRTISSSLDAYHYVLVHNCWHLWKNGGIIPNLTSSGFFTRNSWYMLAYKDLPGYTDLRIPPDWRVRAGDVPSLLVASLSYHGDQRKTIEILEDARSAARMISQDLQKVPEIQRGLADYDVRNRLSKENPKVEVLANTIELIQRLDPKQASLKRDRGWRAFSHRRSFFACCFVPIVTTTCNEDRLRLLCFALLLCLSVFDAPLSPFFSFAPASRDIADALGHENLSSRIWSNVEKNVSRCLL